MIIWEIIKLAFSSLAANTLRSALTVLGIAVGVFSLIGVMTFVTGAREALESGLSRLGANSFQIERFPAINFSNPWLRYGNRRDITYPMAERFKELMASAASVNVQTRRGGHVATFLDRRTNPNTNLIGTDENYLTAANYELDYGRTLRAEDVSLGRSVCVLGADVVTALFAGEEPIGSTIRVGGQNYTVIGVVAAKGTSLGESQDSFVLIPITRWLMVYGRTNRSLGINVQAPNRESYGDVWDQAIGAMRLVRGLAPEDQNDFEVFSNESLIETFNNVVGIVATGAFVISAIALLTAGVGVMNIMLVSVTERTKEIGVRKSIGARKFDILTQFLVEAVALALVGGLAGVSLGVIGGNAIAMQMGMDVSFPWMWASLGFGLCSAIGLIFGIYPAWKAAALDPIEALRYE